MLATMMPGRSFATAAQLAYPDRQSVAIFGDGGFAMLMAELSTAVAQNLPVKIILLKNNSLAEVNSNSRRSEIPNMAVRLRRSISSLLPKPAAATPIIANAPEEIRPAISAVLIAKGRLVEAEERPTKPQELKA
jgi:pyruvate dehydrogenase (quinone)/pyruvate decarboxylase